ncbi:hypothetical protein HDU99_000961 [Rhizoclosmatium hyalinum]|nr:hypothetical protein HDU99_000961 [Rhizoclosmatium hyalinum]
MAIPSFARPSTATVASTASSISIVEKLKGWRPRLFMLMTLFIAASSITVGVLGWRLTLDAAKNNINDLVQEIQDLISNRITSYIVDEGSRLSDFVALQQDLFRNNVLSAATPERKNQTLQTLLSLLNRNKQTSADVFYVTYPAGEITGYTYNSTGDLQMWTQQGLTVTTWTCDSNGIPVGNPYSVLTDVGDGTPQNPGNNRLLNWGPGGAAKVNLNYSSDNDTGISITYPWNERLFKTTVGLTVNKVTGEKVIVGGDWTMSLLSQQLENINAAIQYPLFIGLFGTTTGNLIASSPKVVNRSADKTRMLGLHEINDTFVHDFDGYLNATYGNGDG